jgi:crossover junction endodeoxyribonuclease RuvC
MVDRVVAASVEAVNAESAGWCVLGVDPGSRVTGWGVLSWQGEALQSASGTIAMARSLETPQRLQTIYRGLVEVIEAHRPDVVAVERPFHNQYARSAMVLGQALAAAMLAAAERHVPVVEYAPREIKQSVSGDGNAEKSAVAEALRLQLGMKVVAETTDASDALAVAYCHAVLTQRGTVETRGMAGSG